MVTSFLGGILRVWGLSPRLHGVGVNQKMSVGLYWDHWECTGNLETCSGSTGRFGACTGACTGATLRATGPTLGGVLGTLGYVESCSLRLALFWKPWVHSGDHIRILI